MIPSFLNDRKDPWKMWIVLGRWDRKIVGSKSGFWQPWAILYNDCTLCWSLITVHYFSEKPLLATMQDYWHYSICQENMWYLLQMLLQFDSKPMRSICKKKKKKTHVMMLFPTVTSRPLILIFLKKLKKKIKIWKKKGVGMCVYSFRPTWTQLMHVIGSLE